MPPSRIRRRRALQIGAGVAGAALLDAFVVEPNWLDSELHNIAIDGLANSLEGLTIAHITDAHLTEIGMLEEGIIERVRAAAPEIVVLTGDLIDAETRLTTLEALSDALQSSGANVIATLGNWEHWGNVPLQALTKSYNKTNAQLLINEQVTLHGISLFGTDDSTAGAPIISSTRSGPAPSILLTHSPAYVDQHPDSSNRFDLVLSGHTHGGQVTAAGMAPVLPPGSGRFVAGFYDTPLGTMYVSRGTGTSIAPVRMMCRPELPMFRLVRA